MLQQRSGMLFDFLPMRVLRERLGEEQRKVCCDKKETKIHRTRDANILLWFIQ